MKNFNYVNKEETAPVREQMEEIIRQVQDEVRNHFTFQYFIVGSAKRNMITRDEKNNTGFDFDYNIQPNCDFNDYSPAEIKRILRLAFEKVGKKYGYTKCEDSTRVITIKQYAYGLYRSNEIFHSCDFAIVRKLGKTVQYIHYDKSTGRYYWENQPKEFYKIDDKVRYIKREKCWNDVIDEYIYLKRNNTDSEKKSRSLYAEAVNNIYNQLKNE